MQVEYEDPVEDWDFEEIAVQWRTVLNSVLREMEPFLEEAESLNGVQYMSGNSSSWERESVIRRLVDFMRRLRPMVDRWMKQTREFTRFYDFMYANYDLTMDEKNTLAILQHADEIINEHLDDFYDGIDKMESFVSQLDY